MLLSNKVALITGGAKGMGRAMAVKFAAEGCDVAIGDLDLNAANETLTQVREKGREGLAVRCDVSSANDLRTMVDAAIAKFGKINILVNNAGGLVAAPPTSITGITEEEWDVVVGRNLKSVFLCSKEVIPYMKKQSEGNIINISSVAALYPPSVNTHYHSAKAGVVGLTYDMARELGPFNIRVNAIMPGAIRTAFYDPIFKSMTKEQLDATFDQIGNGVPLKRIGTPEDIAGVALFLSSELAAYVTGTVINVTGGLPLQPDPS